MQDVSIRRAGDADLPEIVVLSREHAEYEAAAYVHDGQEDRLRAALSGPEPKLVAWVVTGADRAIGYMTATKDFATWTARPFIHMDCLYLRPAYRRKGIGARLIACLSAFAQASGIDLIQWQTPRDNEDGIAFYERVGAIGMDKRRYFLPVHRT